MYRFFISYYSSKGFGNIIVESKNFEVSRSFIREWEQVLDSKYGCCVILNIVPISNDER